MKNKYIKNNRGSRFIKSYSTFLKRSPEYSRGFTLVESLFAIFILTFTITGLMTIVSNSLFSSRYSKDEITVNYLLQEVIDSVRNDRDTTVFINNNWSSFVGHYDNCIGDSGCYFDVNADNISRKVCIESSNLCPSLYYNENSTESFYNYTDTDKVKTNFIRKIVVKPEGDTMTVTVTVNWKNGGVNMSRSLSTSFLNWQKQ